LAHGLILAPILLVTAGALGLALNIKFLAILALYLVTNVAYSLVIKRKMMIDVVTLACLYGLRLFAGGAAVGVPLSEWLCTFSIFIFTSLALIKRCAELNGKI